MILTGLSPCTKRKLRVIKSQMRQSLNSDQAYLYQGEAVSDKPHQLLLCFLSVLATL